MGQFTKPVTDDSFESDVLKANELVLVDFWAEWCGPCRALGPKLEEIAQEMSGSVKIVKMNVDENQKTPGTFGIRGIPAMLLFKGGNKVGELVGNHPKENIAALIKENA